ncbi:RluA family pseudouridine synthase [Rubritalea tangerina]|uniref:RluA family pseudouridine synthase n=1 Tax=Rubritalea tangerina TaxID=430798 RepID=A0ABW4ZFG7_9BACT
MSNDVLDILYCDDSLLAVNKPSGLASVPGKGPHAQDSLTHRVLKSFPHAPRHPAVHRLDMDTSGIMLFALDPTTHRALSRQFQDRETQKEYIAQLETPLTQSHGIIELPFRLDINDRPRQIYDPVHGKWGTTDWELIENREDSARVLFRPLTGRTHQLRIHSAHPLGLASPIIGDTLYGHGTTHGELRLHSSKLTFTHPTSLASITITSQPLW